MHSLNEWLGLCRRQIGRFYGWRAASTGLGLVLGFSLVAAWLGYSYGYDSTLTLTLRILLMLCLALGIWLLVWRPSRSLKHKGGVELIEQRLPAMNGRLRTLEETASRDPNHPLLPLLTRDAEGYALQSDPASLVSQRWLHGLRTITAFLLIGLVWMAFFAPGNWSYGTWHYLAGWATPGALPPLHLLVEPGDGRVRRGAGFDVLAQTQGFAPNEVSLYAQYDGEDWQQVSMQRQGSGQFSFRFYGVHQPLTYYVSAAGINSQRFRVEVADLPAIERISLRYQYPEWTHMEDREQTFGTAIQGIEGTLVSLEIHSDRPLSRGEILIDDQPLALETQGNISRVTFELTQSGRYYLADQFEGNRVSLTDQYPIRVVADTAPTLTALRPGGDWSATNIEEVRLSFRAEDDFHVEGAVLHYSVNGGPWQSEPLDGSGRQVELEHMLFLEDMAADEGGLVPGDLISYYLEVRDRQRSTESDIYFIDVQPFERRYSQAQQGGGGGAGGDGGMESEISSRQREILVSTWNLIRQRDHTERPADPQYVVDNADMLSELQLTLAQQTNTMIQRSQARGLDQADADISRFIRHLEEALAAMDPAVQLLDDTELDDSIPAQQRALQHLLRAESVFRDIQVSMQRNTGGGQNRRSNAARDMADIYELEMDLSRNQYETRQPTSLQEPEQAMDDAFDQLRDLAQRQQQLAEQMRRNNGPNLSQRWQQEQLRREAERLREELERMQRSANSSDPSQQAAAESLQQQLDSVIEDMRQAADPGQQTGPGGTGAAASAGEQLQRSLEQLSEARQQALQNDFESFARQARDLRDRQAEIDSRLQEALSRAMAERRETGRFSSGLSPDQQTDLAQEKRDMAQDLRSLRDRMSQASGRASEDMPEAADALRAGADLLRVTRLDARLEEDADSIDYGMAPAVASREAVTNQILDALQADLARAAEIASAGSTRGDQRQQQLTTEQQIRQLREQLAESLEAGQPGDPGAAGPGGGRGALDPSGENWGRAAWSYRGLPPYREGLRQADLEDWARLTSSRLQALGGELLDSGIAEQDLLESQRLARQLMDQRGDDADRVNALRNLVSQLERLELRLTSDAIQRGLPVRGVEQSRPDIMDSTAEYFRRLSEGYQEDQVRE